MPDPRPGGVRPSSSRFFTPILRALQLSPFCLPPANPYAIDGIFAISLDLHTRLVFVHVLPEYWIGDGVSKVGSFALFKQTLQALTLMLDSADRFKCPGYEKLLLDLDGWTSPLF